MEMIVGILLFLKLQLSMSNEQPQNIDDLQSKDGSNKQHIFHQQTSMSIEREIKHKKQSSPNVRRPRNDRCNNRECNKAPGYPEKPGSIYCSAKCQSRGKFNHKISDKNNLIYFLIN